MAHQLYTPEQAARSTLAAVRYKSTLARLVNTDYSTEFTAGRGASVTVKRPVMLDKARVYTAENRKNGDAITYTDLVQPYTSVRISDQVYQAVKLPDDFVTFTLESLENQVVGPMAESVAEHLNKVVIDAFGSVKSGLLSGFDADPKDAAAKPYLGTDGTAYKDLDELRAANTEFAGFAAGVTVKAADLKAKYRGDVSKAIRAAHQLLGQRGVPLNGRYLAVGANWEAALLGLDNLNKVNEAGNPDTLRDATLGRLYGFNIVVDYAIDPNAAYAFQRDAITLVTRTTALPRGAAFSSTVAKDGFTMRYLQDYDPDHLTDRAVVDTFAGAQVLDPQRIVKLDGANTMVDEAPTASSGSTGGATS